MLMNHPNIEHAANNYKFFCRFCNYGCSRQFLMKQHEATKKHYRAYCSKNAQKNMLSYLCDCGRAYKHIQSYNRHIKTCNYNNNSIDSEENIIISTDKNSLSCDNNINDLEVKELKNIITNLIQQNNSFLIENGEMRKMIQDMIPNIGNNNTTVNAHFNINMFLNEQCKDAINLTDFVKTLNLELSDLNNTCENGYINGIATIFVNGLKQLDLHQRPIHCSDIKREVLYVKENDIWEKEDADRSNIRNAINIISKKQVDIIKKWEQANPNWQETDKGTTAFCKMVKEVTSGGEDETNNRIIKTIAKEITIDKKYKNI